MFQLHLFMVPIKWALVIFFSLLACISVWSKEAKTTKIVWGLTVLSDRLKSVQSSLHLEDANSLLEALMIIEQKVGLEI